jgi:hypothetical protein
MNNITYIYTYENRIKADPYGTSICLGFKDLGYEVNFFSSFAAGLKKYYYGNDSMDEKDIQIDKIFIPHNFLTMNSKMIFKILNDTKLIIFNCAPFVRKPKKGKIEEFKKWGRILNKYNNKLVVLDCMPHSGRSTNISPILKKIKYKLFLRKEIPKEGNKNIVSFNPMGCTDILKKEIERDILVSAIFGGDPTKKQFRTSLIKNLKKEIKNGHFSINKKVPFEKYMEILNRSKISITGWGLAYGCYREWEILSSESLLAYKPSPNPHLDDFIDMESAITYNTSKELIEKIKFLEKNPDELERIRLNGVKIKNEKHMNKHRALKLIEEYENIGGNS